MTKKDEKTIGFVQHFPNGIEPKDIFVHVPYDIGIKADKLVKAGKSFSLKLMSDGSVCLRCADSAVICNMDMDTPKHVNQLVEDAYNLMIEGDK